MFTRLAAVAAATLFASSAAAEAPDVGQNAVNAAHVTASKLRHQWDLARIRDARAATCLEPKVAEAMVLISRIDHRRVEMRDSADETTRQGARRSLFVLEGRRKELEAEAATCGANVAPTIVGGTTVTMQILASIAAHDASIPAAPEPELLRALLGPMNAR
jgi:hypothetical protein